tara:strand:+ start:189 stop:551 length:363 start_codon:yes stop_codon:yes gene_type:complete
MGFYYNHVILVGRLTKDPELKHISETFSVLTFPLAVTRSRRKSQKEDKVDFIPVSIRGNFAGIGNQLLSKGVPVLVWGQIEVRRYDKENETRWITEIIANNFQILESLSQSKKEVMKELV